jgi:hypothetical protein
MISNLRKAAIVASALGTAAAFVTPVAFASSAKPAVADASISPASTTIKGSSTKAVFVAPVDGIDLTVTCTSFKSSGKTPASGLTVELPTAPTYSGCTDSAGGTDTVKTSGAWTITANSTGSQLTIGLPKDAATFTSSILSGCVVTIAPSGATTLTGKYNDSNKLTLTKAKFAIGGNAECAAGPTSTATQTVTFKPGFKVVS